MAHQAVEAYVSVGPLPGSLSVAPLAIAQVSLVATDGAHPCRHAAARVQRVDLSPCVSTAVDDGSIVGPTALHGTSARPGQRHAAEHPLGRIGNGMVSNIRWVGNPTQWTAEHQARRNEHPQGRGAWRIANPYTQWVWIANPDQRHDTNIRGVGIQTNRSRTSAGSEARHEHPPGRVEDHQCLFLVNPPGFTHNTSINGTRL